MSVSVTRRAAIIAGGLGLAAAPQGVAAAQGKANATIPGLVGPTNSPTIIADDYPGAGDGTVGGTAALQDAFNAARGKALALGPEKTYVVTSPILAPKNITLVSNGSKIAKKGVGSWALITNDGFYADRLDVETPGDSLANDQGVYVAGNDVHIGHLRVVSLQGDTPGLNGVVIGNAQAVTATPRTNVRIDRLEVKGFQRPVRILNLADSCIANIDIRNFVVGVYLQNNVSNVNFLRATVSGTSASSSRGPFSGMNGLLIESAADFNTSGLRFTDWTVDGAPEHSYRLGGGYSVTDVTYTNCVSRNPGNAPGNVSTGGGAFKALGTVGHWHSNIRYINCLAEDSNTDANGVNNFSQFSFGFCEDVVLAAPIIRARSKAYSAQVGLFLNSVKHFDVISPNFKATKAYTVFIGKDGTDNSLSGVSDIRFSGGILDSASNGVQCLVLDTKQTVTKNVYFNDVTCSRGQAAWRSNAPITVGSDVGKYLNININIYYQDAPTQNATPPVQTSNTDVTHCYRGPVYGVSMGGRDGSYYVDQKTGEARVRRAATWFPA